MLSSCLIVGAKMAFSVRYDNPLSSYFGGIDASRKRIDSYICEENLLKWDWEIGHSHHSSIAYLVREKSSCREIISRMHEDRCRPATLRELLAFTVVNIESPVQYPIVALGSLWIASEQHSFATFASWEVTKYSMKVSLGLTHIKSAAPEQCFFLAIRC